MKVFLVIVLSCTILIFTYGAFYLNEKTMSYSNLYNNDSLLVCLRSFEYVQISRGNNLSLKENNLIGELKKEAPVLCLRIADLNCSVCIDREMERILKVANEQKMKIALIGSFVNKRSLKVFKSKCNDKISLYEISNEQLGWDIDRLNVPYYFVLYPNLRTSDFFIPEKSFPAITNQYLEGINQLLNSSKE